MPSFPPFLTIPSLVQRMYNMTEESFSKQTYTLEDFANDTFWRDLGSKDTDSIYWNYGLWAEQERLRKDLDEGVVVNSEWCNENFRIPRTLHHGMYEYLKGANEFRCRVAIALYYGDKFTQDGACSSFYSGDTKYQQRPAPDYVIQYFEKRKYYPSSSKRNGSRKLFLERRQKSIGKSSPIGLPD